MLDQVDLSLKLEKSDYHSAMAELETSLAALQRKAIERKIPVVVVFEGWEAAGKGTLINRFIRALDPRHFSVYSINSTTAEEAARPYLWRFWTKTPARGRLAVFDRSWYQRVLSDRVNKKTKKSELATAYRELECFERQLTDDGNLIVKFFLHISKEEQKRRYESLEGNPSTAWRITKNDWVHHRRYDKYYTAAESMLQISDTANAPWTVIAAHDRRFATVKIFRTMVERLTEKIASLDYGGEPRLGSPAERETRESVMPGGEAGILDSIDLSVSLSREEYGEKLDGYRAHLRNLEHEVYAHRVPVIIAYEGWDAAGKGGNIRRLTQSLDPRGYAVIPVGAPNDLEREHHYLWRFWRVMPKVGHIAIFDRSWYGRVLVERVEGLITEAEWKRAYREINEMEEQLTSFGSILIKFWLHIDRETQIQRFQEREQTPHKRWKITEEDWRNREKWDDYRAAVDEMLAKTDTPVAPWTIVESNSKHHARLKTITTVIEAIESRL